jgi:hypothetical protein
MTLMMLNGVYFTRIWQMSRGKHSWRAGSASKRGRYGNVRKIEADGHVFDSQREYKRYCDLKLMLKAGAIRDLEVHPKFPIEIGGVPIMVSSNQHEKWDRQLVYEADFQYVDVERGGKVVTEDVKMQSGHRENIYKLKRALMRAMGHDITEV